MAVMHKKLTRKPFYNEMQPSGRINQKRISPVSRSDLLEPQSMAEDQ
jgi:hypothetical protein